MQDINEKKEWTNWSEDIRFVPRSILSPSTESDLQKLVKKAISDKNTIRTVGASHSCSKIFETRDILVSMEKFEEMLSADPVTKIAGVRPGMTVEEIGNYLFEKGLGLENTGHINKQTIAGAISTGTHGAGKHLTNMSGQVFGLRLVTGTGEIREFDENNNPELMRALKVSLGSFGIVTQVKLKVLPAFKLHRIQYCAALQDCLNNLDFLMDENRNFCFYWYPRRDDVSIRTWNYEDEKKALLPFGKMYKQDIGWGKDVLPTDQQLKFNELEYSVAIDAAVDCFKEIRKRVLEKHRQAVCWRILFRPVAKDDVFLSNAYARDSVSITIHQNAGLPYKEYFDDIEKIFWKYGARPHWGKKHTLTASTLKTLYPMWNRFQEIRQSMDPYGVFLNNHLQKLFTGN